MSHEDFGKGEKPKEFEKSQDEIFENKETLHKAASPVAAKTANLKIWGGRALLGIAGIFLVIALFGGGSKKEKPADNTSVTENNTENVAPPTLTPSNDTKNLPLSNQQIEKLKQVNNGADSDEAQRQALEAAAKAAEIRMSAPSDMLSNNQNGNSSASSTNSTDKNNAVLGGDGIGDANTQFMAKVSQSEAPTAKATRIAHMETTLAQGNIIQATLDTRVDSDLPGMLRAVTSSDVYSEDNSTVLIPRGSRLIGQYTNSVQQGQNRIFVVWQRVIRPDGIDVQLGSPGTDSLGTAGFAADSIDHHFFQQFGTAILLSIIGAGTANLGVNSADQYNSAAAYRMAIAASFNQTAQQNLKNTGVIPPTLYINQGTKISVFVARDLDFYDALNSENQGYTQNTGSLFKGNLN
jgi:type IV secretion system protein VirB10